MRRHQNTATQPFLEMPVFQNWDVIAKGWYFACRSRELARGSVRSMNLCGQHLVLFRGEAAFPLPGFEDLGDRETRIAFGRPYERSCHHHVTMINGIDPQHLRTVHGFDIDMDRPIAVFIGAVNRLEPSIWSKPSREGEEGGAGRAGADVLPAEARG